MLFVFCAVDEGVMVGWSGGSAPWDFRSRDGWMVSSGAADPPPLLKVQIRTRSGAVKKIWGASEAPFG